MLQKLYKILKKIIFSAFFLYGYNVIAAPLNIFIPINLITVFLISILGIPSLFALMIISLLT